MRKEALAQWLGKRVSNIRKEASAVKPGFFPETIHQLRTETKKLRAMMRLISLESGKDLKLPKQFHKLYRAAGAVRDRQMQLQYIATDKQHTLPAFAVWLAHKTGDAARKWHHQYAETTVRALKDHVAHGSVPHLQVPTLLRYYTAHLEKIRTMTEDDPDDESLHEIRKEAKDMQYVLSVCKKEWPEAYRLIRPLEKSLERLSEKAGAYNDRRNMLDGLEQFRQEYKTELDDRQDAEVARVIKDWTEAKAKERKALLTAIRQLARRKIGLYTAP